MLTPKYLSTVASNVINLYEDVEDEILKDIARRIRKENKVTATAERQMEVLIENGYSYEKLEEKLEPYLNDIENELENVLNESGIKHYANEKKAYERANKNLIDYTKNDRAHKITRQIRTELLNNNKILTNSIGLAYDGKSFKLNDFYKKQLNKSILMVGSGAFDRETATRKLINNLGDSGIRAINYNQSGRNYSLESASRMLVRTAVSQMTGKISLMNAEDMGQDLMELTAHSGARPSHSVWQGKIVSLSGKNSKYLSLEDIEYGEVTGFKGANCRHDWYPFFEGISERSYSDEELEEIDPPPFEYEGETYTQYQATQKARQMERGIRKYKKRSIMYKEMGDDDALLVNKSMMKQQYNKYRDFIDVADLKPRYGSMYVYQ
ncbi:phage minor capsid protein [Anaerococcus cruorum]|uniref:Phage minor capsid protein n=1 Tax=Anaerococcus cruorum TaxID=3115617 RepID=A0ABW9MWE0_9FIRM